MVQQDQSRGKRKERTGFVISHAMQKTIVVKAERRVRHPLYGKEMKLYKKMYAHDEKDEAKVGDKVLIEETRPLSKLKRWRLVKILQSGRAVKQTGNVA
jgi:small subunit ribosomal protein S17